MRQDEAGDNNHKRNNIKAIFHSPTDVNLFSENTGQYYGQLANAHH